MVPMARLSALLAFGWALLAAAAGQQLPPRPAKPSVLLLVSDDLRPQLEIPGYSAGGAPVATPRLKQLAAESVVFTRAYCQEALCAPSRNSFLSGRRPDTTKAWQFRDSFREGAGASWTALPQLFRLAGWLTVGAGDAAARSHPPPNDPPSPTHTPTPALPLPPPPLTPTPTPTIPLAGTVP